MATLQDALKAALAQAGRPTAVDQGGEPPTARQASVEDARGAGSARPEAPVARHDDSPRDSTEQRRVQYRERRREVDAQSDPDPFRLPRQRIHGHTEWWVKLIGPVEVEWAILEYNAAAGVTFAYLIGQDSGVVERFHWLHEQDVRVGLHRRGFALLRSRPLAVRRRVIPPRGPLWVSERARPAGPAAAGSGAPRPDTRGSQSSGESASPPPPPPPPPQPKRPVVEVVGTPQCLLDRDTGSTKPLRRLQLAVGRRLQCPGRDKTDEHEVTIGLDFGTSSTKVVIGDSSLERAFAVPFCKAEGVGAYLLPSRLFESRIAAATVRSGPRVMSLEAGDVACRDIKLGWLAKPESEERQARVVAFLALVLRHARGWLLTEHASIFKPVTIIWRVAVGLPAASVLDNRLADEMNRLARRAWHVSCLPGEVTTEVVAASAALTLEPADDEPQIDVVPEIAAQIYGFVNSHSFDRRAPNRYLLVDIGAGTVDSSLFRVRPGRGRQWEFEFYTAVVQPHGVANLHVHRINWWQEVLQGAPRSSRVLASLESNKFATDFELGIPPRYPDYVDGVRVDDSGAAAADPDDEFLVRRVVKQVRGETLYRAWREGLLPTGDIKEIPMFLCGGGSRMAFYQRIESNLRPQPGFTWLCAEPWVLGFPGDLECEEPIDADYDRLSVAYGLSRLDAGRVLRALPMPVVKSPEPTPWTDRYIDKDQM